MFAYNIIVKNNNPEYGDFAADCSAYVYFLERNGQVFKREHMVVLDGNTIKIPVVCPEKNAFSITNCTQFALKIKKRITQQSGSKINYIPSGADVDYINYKLPKNSSFYVLRYGRFSPLVCGDTFRGIPLYKIPYTDGDGTGYDNINFWENDYKRLNGLWLGPYETFAQKELQNVHSKINKEGRALCKLIETLTSVPTYYFLFNYRNWGPTKDRNRKCPITGNDWLLEGKTPDDPIAFKCEESRLVSELSHNCR